MDVRCSSPNLNLEKLKSNHNEADTWMVLSIAHSQAKNIIVESQDADVFIVLIANIKHFGGKQVYMKQNIRKEYKITDIGATVRGLHDESLSPDSLPLLHALTGCDSNSYLYGIGKSTASTVLKEFHHFIDGINSGYPSTSNYEPRVIYVLIIQGQGGINVRGYTHNKYFINRST